MALIIEGHIAQVYKRGAPPGGGGEVQVRVPVARSLPPISLLEEGKPLFAMPVILRHSLLCTSMHVTYQAILTLAASKSCSGA